MDTRSGRFEALDSWRGLSACAIVILHFSSRIDWSLGEVAIIHHFYLFVDFFFVLSGFVMAASYEGRIKDGYGIGPYMILRWFRIYPLHLATLIAMIVIQLVWAVDSNRYDLRPLISNLFLLQGVGVEAGLTWNFPSWSISAEFYTYLVFALLWALLAERPRTLTLVIGSFILVCPIVIHLLSPTEMSAPIPLGLVRCVYGFACGVLLWRLYRSKAAYIESLRVTPAVATAVELGLLGLLAIFIKFAGTTPVSLAAPLVFAVVVFVFAFEGGAVSRLLRTPPLLLLGALSYSIYLVHVPVLALLQRSVRDVEETLSVDISSVEVSLHNGLALLGATTRMGDVFVVATFALVIGISWITYRGIEKPCQDYGRRLVRRWKTRDDAAPRNANNLDESPERLSPP